MLWNRFDGDLIINNGSLHRLNPNFADVQYGTSNGDSIGNFGSALIQRRLSHGLALRGIYTYGKTLHPRHIEGAEALAPLVMTGHSWIVLAIGFVVSFIVAL